MKRLLSWLLVLVMVFGLLPMSAFAVENDVDISTGNDDFELGMDELLPTEPEFGTAENPLALVEGENKFTVIPGTTFYATYPNNGKDYIMTVAGTDAFSAFQFMMVNGMGDAENSVELTLNNGYADAMGYGLTFDSTAEVESVELTVTLVEKVVAPGSDEAHAIEVSVSKAAPLSQTANVTAMGASVYYKVTFVDAGYVKFEGQSASFGIDGESGESVIIPVEANYVSILAVGEVDYKVAQVPFTATYLTDAEAAEIDAAKAVIDQINGLVQYNWDTWEKELVDGVDAAAVAEVRAAYDALSDAGKAYVGDKVSDLELAEELTIVKFGWSGMSVELKDSLAAKFVFSNKTLVGEDNYAVISKEVYDKTTGEITIEDITIPQSDWGWYNEKGGLMQIVYNGVAAKMMMDEFTVVVYNAKGQQISETYVRTIEDYLYGRLDASNVNAVTKTVCVDFLNYGSAAQEYFTYRPTELANAKLTDAQKAIATSEDSISGVKNEQVMGKMAGLAVSAEYEIVPSFVFKNTDLANIAYATVSYTTFKGVEVSKIVPIADFGVYNASMKKVEIRGTAIADGASPITVTLHTADDAVVSTSVDCVNFYAVRNASKHAVFTELMKLIYSAGVAFA